MADTWQRVIGAFLLIVSMGTSTCAALWNVRADLHDRDTARIEAQP